MMNNIFHDKIILILLTYKNRVQFTKKPLIESITLPFLFDLNTFSQFIKKTEHQISRCDNLKAETRLGGEISKIVDGTGEGTQKGRDNHAHINKET